MGDPAAITYIGVDAKSKPEYSKALGWGFGKHADVVRAMISLADGSIMYQDSGIPIYIDSKRTVALNDKKSGKLDWKRKSIIKKALDTATAEIKGYKAENVIKAIRALEAIFANKVSLSKYDRTQLILVLRMSGLTLEALNAIGEAVAKGVKGDELVKLILEKAGIPESEIKYSKEYEDQHKRVESGLKAFEATAQAYARKPNDSKIDRKRLYEGAQKAYEDAVKKYREMGGEITPDQKTRYSKATKYEDETPDRNAVAGRDGSPATPPKTGNLVPKRLKGMTDTQYTNWTRLNYYVGYRVEWSVAKKIIEDGYLDKQEAERLKMNTAFFGVIDNNSQALHTAAKGEGFNDGRIHFATEGATFDRWIQKIASRCENCATAEGINLIWASFRASEYFTNIDIEEVNGTLETIHGEVAALNIDFGKMGDEDYSRKMTGKLKGALGGHIDSNILSLVIARIEEGKIKSIADIERFVFSAAIATMSGLYKEWGMKDVEELAKEGKIGAWKGKNFAAWLRKGEVEEEDEEGGTKDDADLRKAQIAREKIKEAPNGGKALAIYRKAVKDGKLKKNDQEALQIIARKYYDKEEFGELVPFAADKLDPRTRKEFYKSIFQELHDELRPMISDKERLNEAKTLLGKIDDLVREMGEDGVRYSQDIQRLKFQLAMKYAKEGNDTEAKGLVNNIPENSDLILGSGDDARDITQVEARFYIAETLNDKAPMEAVIEDDKAKPADKALAHIYLSHLEEEPTTKQKAEARLEILKKAAEAIQDDESGKANRLRKRIRAEMNQVISEYRQVATTQYQITALTNKYLDKLPGPKAESKPKAGGGGKVKGGAGSGTSGDWTNL
jgi:hypothetical protein